MKHKTIKLFILLILFSAVQAFSYDNLKTHPQLTEAAVAIYNNQTDNKLTQEQINWLKDGSIAEDTDPRYINHYYNPINGQGVSGWDTYKGIPILVNGLPAKVWAKSQSSATGDYSVNAVFKNYRDGNFKRAYQGIGHIAHLIQDMAVPAHTRNDAHADGDPYEIWTEQYGAVNLIKVDFIQADSIDKIFDELAGYSNAYFVSRDTTVNIDISNYKKIEENKNGIKIKYLVNSLNNKNYKYCIYDDSSIKPIFKFNDNLYLNLDYWNMLYPQAVGYSAGAIDYFIKGFAEIDQEKAQEKQLSFWQKIGNSALGLLDNISYAWGDTFLAIRNTTADDWNNVTGAANNTYDFSQLVYESGKEIAADAARKGADAFADIGGQVLSAATTAAESVKHPIKADDLFKIKKTAADEIPPKGDAAPQSSCGKDCGKKETSQSSCGRDCDATKRNSAQDNGKEQNNNGGAKKDTLQSSYKKDCVGKETSQSPAGDCDATGTPQSLAGNYGKAKITPLAKGDVARDTAKTPDKAIGNKSNGSSSVAIDKEIKDIAVKAGAIIPIIEIISKPPAVSSSTKADFQFSVSNEKDFQCKLDSAEWQICQKQISFQDLSQGTHSLKLLAVSETGDIASSSYDWLIDITAPAVKIVLPHIVISEIYFNETNNGSEWIELYNPTENNVSIGNWTIDTKSDDDADATLPANAAIIKNGYYLIGDSASNIGWNPDNINWPTPDHIETITLNNSDGWLRLKNSASEIIDSVGWKKSGIVDVYETAPINIADFSKGQSAERKAVASSTAEQMASNGAHELSGNGYDADNNQNDFIIRLIPEPQNSQSPVEPREPVAPEAVGDLIISQPFTGSNSITLYWTAPQNGNIKNSARYDLRYQEKNGDCNLDSTWESATAVASTTLPVPGSEGEAQEAKISGLEKETAYCFALKIFNGEAWSNISNQVEAKTLPDIVACTAIPADEQGIIQTDQLLLAHSPYCSDIYHLTIPQGQVLTIEPGVVVKLKEASNFTVKGELRAIGLPGQPIVFTSYYDNAKGGKVSESDHSPAPGDWGFIAAGPGGKLFMENAVVNYGGYTVYSPAMMQAPETSGGVVYASGGEAKIKNCQIYNNIGGVYILAGASATVSSSDIFSNQFAGIEINTKNAEINITGSNIYDNGAAGILIAYTASSTLNVFNSKIYDNHAGVINDSYTNEPINAVNNWWGDNSGPYHATENPSGQGNKVEGAVLFDPWTGK